MPPGLGLVLGAPGTLQVFASFSKDPGGAVEDRLNRHTDTHSCSHAPGRTLRHAHTDTFSHTRMRAHGHIQVPTNTHFWITLNTFTETPTCECTPSSHSHQHAHTRVYTLSSHIHTLKRMQTHTRVHTTPTVLTYTTHMYSVTHVHTHSAPPGEEQVEPVGVGGGVCELWGVLGFQSWSQLSASVTHCFPPPTS